MSVRNALRKVIPLRASTFEKARKRLEASNVATAEKICLLEAKSAEIATKLDHLDATFDERVTSMVTQEATSALVAAKLDQVITRFDKIAEDIANLNSSVHAKQDATLYQITQAHKISKEILWAETLDRTLSGSTWFKDVSLSPGRWAVGYPYLYALYRSLNEAHPTSILEIGLGQSTNMIGQYATEFDSVNHVVVEHDQSWIDFYLSENKLSDRSKVVHLELEMKEMPECQHEVRAYKGFEDRFKEEKFDLISIDGPFGYDMKELARIDALRILPNALAPSFTIMVDDYNRKGEQNMVKLIKGALSAAGIAFSEGRYEGEKATMAICSKDRAFLTSL